MRKKKKTIEPKPKLVDRIVADLKAGGKAKFDFGTFRLSRRKNGVVKLRLSSAKRPGEVVKVKTYNAVFFRQSDGLRRAIKKL